MDTELDCSECSGIGNFQNSLPCDVCKGTGKLIEGSAYRHLPNVHPLWFGICQDCVGVGCAACRNRGRVFRGKSQEIQHLRRLHTKKPIGLAATVDGKRGAVLPAEKGVA